MTKLEFEEFLSQFFQLFIFRCICIYNYFGIKYKQLKTHYFPDELYQLKEIRLYKNVEEYQTLTKYIDYFIRNNNITLFNLTKFQNDYSYIELLYSCNNKQYRMILNNTHILNIHNYYPPYNKCEIDNHIDVVLSAELVLPESIKDVTKLLNEYSGPNGNFYKDITDYTPLELSHITLEENATLNIMDNNVNEYTFNDDNNVITFQDKFVGRKLKRSHSESNEL